MKKNTKRVFSTLQHNQSGQTLIIIIVVMTLALTIGVIISSRFINTLRNISESDNSSRALAVAEAAIENVLIIPDETLVGYVNHNNCGSDCVLEISGFSGYKARADVTLNFAGSSNEPYKIKIPNGEVYQLSLNGYGSDTEIDVCWDNLSSVYASYIYEQSGGVLSQAYTYNPVGYSGPINGFLEAISNHGHLSCFSITAVGTPRALRVVPYSQESVIYFIPSSGQNIPSQGIEITSVGRSGDAVKTVKVLKTTGYVPEYFDYAVYQKSLSDPLSNRPD
jgi:Tfp pilus assembly protein PilX